ncbi:MAG: ATP-binding protein [Xanthobacteraceae bacterium]
MLWANAVGAAIFGAATPPAAAPRRFDGAFTAQIVRLAATLPSGGQERLERLRGFGSGFNRALTCACSRIVIGEGTSAVLVAAAEPAGPALALADRVRRLFADDAEPIAVFLPSGTLVYATAAVRTLVPAAPSLAGLGLEALVVTAVKTGSATAVTRLGDNDCRVAAIHLGKDDSSVIALTFAPQLSEVPRAEATPLQAEPAPPQALSTTAGAAPPIPQHAPPVAAPVAAAEEATTDRRHPLRFVWHIDAEGRFGVGSDEFAELVGPRTMAAFGRLWSEIAAELKLDPEGRIARALATRETWSGIVVSWPVDDTDERLPVELSGLPVFDRDRSFRGYRGFGVCRDVDGINALARARHERPIGFMPAPESEPEPESAERAAPPHADVPPTAAAPAEPIAAVEAAPPPERPAPGIPQAAANVVPFRQSPPAEAKPADTKSVDTKPAEIKPAESNSAEPKAAPTLSPVERRAFRELAQELTARLRAPFEAPAPAESEAETAEPPAAAPAAAAANEHVLLDRVPLGILVYRHDALLFANRHFLEWSGYEDLAAIEAAGGLDTLFVAPGAGALAETGAAQSLSILTRDGAALAVEGRMFTAPWNGSSALALILTNGPAAAKSAAAQRALEAAETENRELKAILDAGLDSVITIDGQRRIVAVNARAASLFGRAMDEFAGADFIGLFAPESGRAARDYVDRAVRGGNLFGSGIEVTARASDGRSIPLAMTLSRLAGDKFSALFRDITIKRQVEEELRNAKRETQRAAATKAEFLGKVSHEIRTPLNAMTGFAEVIMAERFGPIGNERYREYIKDIHNAGTHLVSMLNDLLDLSKIETGQIDLNFANVNLNDLTQQCVGIMQPQASRARIIIRTSLTPSLPLVVADERSLRQIVLNLLSNSIRFTGPGGQVIVSSAFSDAHEAVLRVRDTGVGMSEKDIQTALEPFQHTATSGSLGSGGTGFGLPLTKALAEANRANFSIKSAPNAGTLVEIAFPPSRIVAD